MLALVMRNTRPGFIQKSLPWLVLTVLESAAAAMSIARIVFGPPSPSLPLLLWFQGAVGLFVIYLCMTMFILAPTTKDDARSAKERSQLLFGLSAPFLIIYLLALTLIQFEPNMGSAIISLVCPIQTQPFPIASAALILLAILFIKLSIALLAMANSRQVQIKKAALSADIAIPVAMLLLGILQASVYLVPIGNAFLRFWAIADATALVDSYPVTLTEPHPVAAGSPPYVYDLPLFPLMLRATFALLGHNSAAAHLPAAVWNALFPLSAFLLIKEMTRSRITAVIFATLVSLFPYLRFWVLNLPDPDPFLLTSSCLAAYLYLRALAAPTRHLLWIAAGIMCGILGLARPEGILYSGFFGLGTLLSRPKAKPFILYLLSIGLFLGPMIAVWMINFGFLWPQNYNRTLSLKYAIENYDILNSNGSLEFYRKGLGLSGESALALLLLFLVAVIVGTLLMIANDKRLLAIAIPGIGNTVMIWFANPWIPNTFHFADFFRHASFGIPFLVVTSAYAFHQLYDHLVKRTRLTRMMAFATLLLLAMVIVREGDILANPTLTHRSDQSEATQVLATYTYLSMQDILSHPWPLPDVSYYPDGTVTVAHITTVAWPETALEFFRPLDMAFDANARPFGYASVVAFMMAFAFALLAERYHPSQEMIGGREDRVIAKGRS